MPRFCASCGAQVADTATFCPACGKSVGQAPANTGYAAAPAPAQAAPAAGGLTDNVAGMLAYVTIIPAIIFLVMEPYNKKPFVRFHAFQCIFLHVAALVAWVALLIVSAILAFIPVLGHLVAFILWLAYSVGLLVVWVVLLLKANQGQMWKLPVIGDMAEKQANAV
jgi:uncharacterized membrane protein